MDEYTGVITQKEVVITPLDRWLHIYEKDPLPEEVFFYDGWIAGDEGNEDYSALRILDWRPYDIESSRSAGLYITIPTTSNSNYTYQIRKGWLVVWNLHEDDHSKSASVSGAAEVEELESDYLNVYPNPVVDKVHITMKDIEHYKMIQLFDIEGRLHPITSIDKRSDNLEIDMAQLPAGYYIFRIVMEDSSRVVQIIKK